MRRAVTVLVALAVIAFVAYEGWQHLQSRRAQQAGLITEDIRHDGDLWKADFTARIPAPEQVVYDALRNIESTHGDQLKAVRVISQNGDNKVVDIDLVGPGGQIITTRMEFHYLPAEKKIVYHTVNNPLFDTQAVYQFGDEGASTFIDYHQTTKLLQQMPVPDGVIKQVIRAIFVAQLEGLKQALHIKTADQADTSDD
ncbi:MAG: hypothetical protein Q7S58_21075 [Candidatus Binatus sp.]|uniref:hypothetical protein n=1 Tax=Candidatus Binatus sp. TaxID=2811406 RepID=UPI00271A4CA6|nr:hypothetical protein [Candidatus Binatus sp.]MDO8434900.1 hypothetical protein [Candidatus Binatus sp.]